MKRPTQCLVFLAVTPRTLFHVYGPYSREPVILVYNIIAPTPTAAAARTILPKFSTLVLPAAPLKA